LKAYVFDLDGTLINSVEAHVSTWVISLKHVGYDVRSDDVKKLIGLSGRDIVFGLAGEDGLMKYEIIRWLKNKGYLHEIAKGNVEVFPCAIELITYLKSKGMRVGLASSTPNYLLIHVTEIFGIIDYFDVIVGGDEVEHGKPHPEIFLRAFSKLGVRPCDGAVVGDTLYDVIPANKIGAFSILVQQGSNTLTQHVVGNQEYSSPLLKVSSLCELLEVVRTHT